MSSRLRRPVERLEIEVPADGRLQLRGERLSQPISAIAACWRQIRRPPRCSPVLSFSAVGNLPRPGLALGDRAAAALASLMVRCEGPCLSRLDLRANEISDAGAAQLAEGIELSRSITHLLMSDNHITDRGALALARALYRNRSLTVLWLDGAWFAMLVAMTITQCLTGISYCVTGNNMSALGTTAISQAVAANEYLTTVLLHRPGGYSQLHRTLSAAEKRDLAVIRQSCVHNQVKRKSRNDLCHRLQMLAWAFAVRPGCEHRRKTAVTKRSRAP